MSDFVCVTVFRRNQWSKEMERCTSPAVWGSGHCAKHRGDPNGRAARERVKAAGKVYGKSVETLREAGLDMGTIDIINHPRAVDPAVLLLEEVARSAGIIAWLENKIASLEETDPGDGGGEGFLTESTTSITEEKSGGGATGNYSVARQEKRQEVSVWWRLLQEERRIAQAAASSALRSNIEERRVRLAERSVNALEAAVAAALMDLGLDPHNDRVRAVVGARLREALADGQNPFGMDAGGVGATFTAPSARVLDAAPADRKAEGEGLPRRADF